MQYITKSQPLHQSQASSMSISTFSDQTLCFKSSSSKINEKIYEHLLSGDDQNENSYSHSLLMNQSQLDKDKIKFFVKTPLNSREREKQCENEQKSKKSNLQNNQITQTQFNSKKWQTFFNQNLTSKLEKQQQNKQNIRYLRNLRLNSISNAFEVQNLIQIVDGMYDKAIDKKIELQVNMAMTNKKKSSFCYLQKQQIIQNPLFTKNDQIKTVQKREIQKNMLDLQKLKQKLDEKSFNNIIEEQKYLKFKKHLDMQCQQAIRILDDSIHTDKCMSTTQRVRVEIIPQQNATQYNCKQQEESFKSDNLQEQKTDSFVKSSQISYSNLGQSKQQATSKVICKCHFHKKNNQTPLRNKYLNNQKISEENQNKLTKHEIKGTQQKQKCQQNVSIFFDSSFGTTALLTQKNFFNSTLNNQNQIKKGRSVSKSKENTLCKDFVLKQQLINKKQKVVSPPSTIKNKNQGIYQSVLSEYSTAKLISIYNKTTGKNSRSSSCKGHSSKISILEQQMLPR